MALRGGASGSRIRFSRPMLIVAGVLVLLVVVVVFLSLSILRRGGRAPAHVPSPVVAATETPEVQAKAEPYPTATVALPTQTPMPTQLAVQPTLPPVPTVPPALSAPTAVPTMVPPPTRPEVAVVPTTTPLPAGGQLPATSGGSPWLLPLGVAFLVLVGAVAWWRWRRARATG
ncbi:MAG: hypothetical protein ACP5SI_04010 [Chloroflexia bacterium]